MKDGRKLLAELGRLRPGSVYFRTHNLLTSGDGTPALKWGSTGAYGEDAQGRPVYNWSIVDRIFDTYLERGVRPYVQIGFMPKELSVKPEPYQHHWTPTAKYDEIFTGWAYPPKDYAKWGELVYQWARHCVEKYGRAEVESWYWETWNEANIGYWRGTPEEFRKLHDYAIDAVRRALPTARVGGADSAGSGGKWTRDFLEHCLRGTNYATGKVGTPIDFVSFHAKGSPSVRRRPRPDGDRRPAADRQRRVPHRRLVPRAEGQADRDRRIRPRGLRRLPGAAVRLPQRHDVLQLHGRELRPQVRPGRTARGEPRRRPDLGLRVRGPAVLRRVPRAGDQRHRPAGPERLPDVQPDGRRAAWRCKARQKSASTPSSPGGVRGAPDVSALAALDGNTLSILAWHYHDDDVPGPDAEVALDISGLPATAGPVLLHHYRVDRHHGNAFEAWKRMGSPQHPTPDQYAELDRSSRLALLDSPEWLRVEGGELKLRVTLPRQAVSLLRHRATRRPGRGAEGPVARPRPIRPDGNLHPSRHRPAPLNDRPPGGQCPGEASSSRAAPRFPRPEDADTDRTHGSPTACIRANPKIS